MSGKILLALLTVVGVLSSPVQTRSNDAVLSTTMASTSRSAPNVTIYPPTPNGEPVTLIGSELLGLDRYLGLPFASPREYLASLKLHC